MNHRTTRVMLLSVACCLVFLLLPLASVDAQCRRELNGTGVGSDIGVPGEPGPECDTELIIIEPKTIYTEPAPPEPIAPEPSPAVVAPEPEIQTPPPFMPRYEEPVVVEERALPVTAGELPWLALIGVLALAGGASLRLVAAKSSR